MECLFGKLLKPGEVCYSLGVGSDPWRPHFFCGRVRSDPAFRSTIQQMADLVWWSQTLERKTVAKQVQDQFVRCHLSVDWQPAGESRVQSRLQGIVKGS